VYGRVRQILDRLARLPHPAVLEELRSRTDGVVAVEFAMLLFPFLALIFVLFNSAFMIFANAVMQGAIASAARQIQTGQMQNVDANCPPTPNATLTNFKNSVCANMLGQISCSNLYFDVHSFANFGAISLPTPTYNAQGQVTNSCFNTGSGGSIVAVRLIYYWQNVVPGMTNFLGAAANSLPLQYTVIIKNEPF